jgi:integrase
VSGEASQKGKGAAGARRSIQRTRVERGIYRRQTRKGVAYEFVYTDSDGKQRWAHCDRLQDARSERAAKLAAVARGERVAPSRKTVAEVAEIWYEQKAPKLRSKTKIGYRRALDLVIVPRFGRWKLREVDADAIVKLIRDLEREGLHALDPSIKARPLGRSSVENYLKPLNGLLAYAVRRGMLPVSPFSVLTGDDRPVNAEQQRAHEWTDEQVEALLAASAKLAAENERRIDYTPFLRVVATLGLRKGEALGLRWGDFDKGEGSDDGVLSVERQWLVSGEYGPVKTESAVRRLVLPADLREELIALRLRSDFSLDEQPVFSSLTGTPLGHRNVLRRGWEPARDAAQLPSHLTLHDLRHAAASKLINGGLDPVTVAAFLGHKDANVTLRVYAHVYEKQRTDEKVRAALARSAS